MGLPLPELALNLGHTSAHPILLDQTTPLQKIHGEYPQEQYCALAQREDSPTHRHGPFLIRHGPKP